jgi:hypothetical protein
LIRLSARKSQRPDPVLLVIGLSQAAGALSLAGGLLQPLVSGFHPPPLYLFLGESFAFLALFAAVQLLRGVDEGLTISRLVLGLQIVQIFSPQIVFDLVLGLHTSVLITGHLVKFRAGFAGEFHFGILGPAITSVEVNFVALIFFLHLWHIPTRKVVDADA